MAAGDATGSTPVMDFETALQNIRRLSNSGLAHQKKPAQLLIALEETLKASLPDVNGPPFSGTAYFASLVQCLERACATGSKDAKDFSEGGLVPATLYLMATVVPETPRQVVTNQTTTLLPVLLPLFDPCLSHPPALRSLVQIFTTIFLLAPVTLLNSSPLLKRAWNHFLELNVDPRPKVRHLAQEGVRKVLTTPIPPKVVAGDHPYLQRAKDWAMGILEEEAKGGQTKVKKVKFAGGMVMAGAEDSEGKRAIWVVQGLRGWVSVMNEDVSTAENRIKWAVLIIHPLLPPGPIIYVPPAPLPSAYAPSHSPNLLLARPPFVACSRICIWNPQGRPTSGPRAEQLARYPQCLA